MNEVDQKNEDIKKLNKDLENAMIAGNPQIIEELKLKYELEISNL